RDRLALAHRTLQLQGDAPHAVVQRVRVDERGYRQDHQQANRGKQPQKRAPLGRTSPAARALTAKRESRQKASVRHQRAHQGVTPMARPTGAVTRWRDGAVAGHMLMIVPSRSNTPPVQIQLTSGLTKTARLTRAVGPSPSQPASTTYRSSKGVDLNPTLVLGCCGKLSKYCFSGRKSCPFTLSTPSITRTPGGWLVWIPWAVIVYAPRLTLSPGATVA